MKNLIFSILIVLTYSNFIYSQSGWVWQNPLPQGNNINDSYFVNENTGYMVGNKGIVLKTMNSGTNWQVQYLSTTQNLNAIKFIDLNTGFIVGDSSKIFKTINGGLNWNKINIAGNLKFSDIDFYDNNMGLITGENIILESTDLGQNWINILTENSSYNLRKVKFYNSETAIVVGKKYIGGLPGYYKSVLLRTSNTGINWTETNLSSGLLNNISLNSNNEIFCTGDRSIFKSTDEGITWTNKINSLFINIIDLAFFDSINGVAVASGGSGIILKTNNGGDSWYEALTYDFYPNCVINSSSSGGFIAGDRGSILKTTNLGSSWILLPSVLQVYGLFYKVQFLNENTGFVVGVGYDAPLYYGGSIIKTTNGGDNWTSIIPCTNVTDIQFTSLNTGYISGKNGVILKTTNSGNNWTCEIISTINFYAMSFGDSLNGTVVGDYGYIYKTSNAGISWSNQYNNSALNLKGVHFVNPNTGTAVGSGQGGAVLHTTNGGNQWVPQNLGPGSYYNLYDVFLINENIGFIIGESSSIYKTTNGGMNWTNTSSFYNMKFNEIKFSDNNNGIIVGDGGLFLKTTNQGLNWKSINTGTDQHIYGASFIDNNTGTIVGDNLGILKTNTGGVVNIKTLSSGFPNTFYLYQNFPNPFNPITKVKFEIPELSNVKLKVFDILGKEIETLINENLKPGLYESDWDATNFPSGIYFYSLITNDFIETKRMILLK